MNTTLNEIRAHQPCTESWKVLLRSLNKTQADDEPLPYARILEICGLNNCLWAIAHCHPHGSRICAEFALWCAESVRHLMMDPRSIAALDVTRQYLDGNATLEQLRAAREAAERATNESSYANAAAYAARAAARASAYAADCASAWAAARAADYAAAREAAYAAHASAWEADDAAGVAGAAAYAAARTAQKSRLLELLEEGMP